MSVRSIISSSNCKNLINFSGLIAPQFLFDQKSLMHINELQFARRYNVRVCKPVKFYSSLFIHSLCRSCANFETAGRERFECFARFDVWHERAQMPRNSTFAFLPVLVVDNCRTKSFVCANLHAFKEAPECIFSVSAVPCVYALTRPRAWHRNKYIDQIWHRITQTARGCRSQRKTFVFFRIARARETQILIE